MTSLTPEKLSDLEEAAYQIRRLSIEMIAYARWGHPGGSLSLADILAVLYFEVMKVDPLNPRAEDRDRLFLSKAHCSPALYAALALKGFFPIDDIYTYCEPEGLEGHTDMTRTSGVEILRGAAGDGIIGGGWLRIWVASKRKSTVTCLLPAGGW